MMETLNELSRLRESGFGRPRPRHGLKLLYWFAKDCVSFGNDNVMFSECDPDDGDFGFHLFEKRNDGNKLLPDKYHPYYVVGNLNIKKYPKAEELPEYVSEDYSSKQLDSNTDRVIVSLNGRESERVYVTQHQDRLNYDPDATHRISRGLLMIIRRMRLDTFLEEMHYGTYIEPTPVFNYRPPTTNTVRPNFKAVTPTSSDSDDSEQERHEDKKTGYYTYTQPVKPTPITKYRPQTTNTVRPNFKAVTPSFGDSDDSEQERHEDKKTGYTYTQPVKPRPVFNYRPQTTNTVRPNFKAVTPTFGDSDDSEHERHEDKKTGYTYTQPVIPRPVFNYRPQTTNTVRPNFTAVTPTSSDSDDSEQERHEDKKTGYYTYTQPVKPTPITKYRPQTTNTVRPNFKAVTPTSSDSDDSEQERHEDKKTGYTYTQPVKPRPVFNYRPQTTNTVRPNFKAVTPTFGDSDDSEQERHEDKKTGYTYTQPVKLRPVFNYRPQTTSKVRPNFKAVTPTSSDSDDSEQERHEDKKTGYYTYTQPVKPTPITKYRPQTTNTVRPNFKAVTPSFGDSDDSEHERHEDKKTGYYTYTQPVKPTPITKYRPQTTNTVRPNFKAVTPTFGDSDDSEQERHEDKKTGYTYTQPVKPRPVFNYRPQTTSKVRPNFKAVTPTSSDSDDSEQERHEDKKTGYYTYTQPVKPTPITKYRPQTTNTVRPNFKAVTPSFGDSDDSEHERHEDKKTGYYTYTQPVKPTPITKYRPQTTNTVRPNFKAVTPTFGDSDDSEQERHEDKKTGYTYTQPVKPRPVFNYRPQTTSKVRPNFKAVTPTSSDSDDSEQERHEDKKTGYYTYTQPVIPRPVFNYRPQTTNTVRPNFKAVTPSFGDSDDSEHERHEDKKTGYTYTQPVKPRPVFNYRPQTTNTVRPNFKAVTPTFGDSDDSEQERHEDKKTGYTYTQPVIPRPVFNYRPQTTNTVRPNFKAVTPTFGDSDDSEHERHEDKKTGYTYTQPVIPRPVFNYRPQTTNTVRPNFKAVTPTFGDSDDSEHERHEDKKTGYTYTQPVIPRPVFNYRPQTTNTVRPNFKAVTPSFSDSDDSEHERHEDKKTGYYTYTQPVKPIPITKYRPQTTSKVRPNFTAVTPSFGDSDDSEHERHEDKKTGYTYTQPVKPRPVFNYRPQTTNTVRPNFKAVIPSFSDSDDSEHERHEEKKTGYYTNIPYDLPRPVTNYRPQTTNKVSPEFTAATKSSNNPLVTWIRDTIILMDSSTQNPSENLHMTEGFWERFCTIL